MVKVRGGVVFDSKIIYDEGEGDGEVAVAKKHGGGGLGRPVGLEELKELELREMTGLGESRNCFGEVKKTERAG